MVLTLRSLSRSTLSMWAERPSLSLSNSIRIRQECAGAVTSVKPSGKLTPLFSPIPFFCFKRRWFDFLLSFPLTTTIKVQVMHNWQTTVKIYFSQSSLVFIYPYYLTESCVCDFTHWSYAWRIRLSAAVPVCSYESRII